MTRRSVPLGLLTAAAAILALPAAAAMAGLAFAGMMSGEAAVAGVAATALLGALLLRPFVADHLAAIAYTCELADNLDAAPPALSSFSLAGGHLAALAMLRRIWRERSSGIQASLESAEAILDGLPDPILLLDATRRVVRANGAAARLFGRDAAGHDLAAVLRHPALLDAADAAIANGTASDVEMVLPVPVERDLRARLERLPKRSTDGAVAVLVLHDLTALKQADKMRADFVANASHELRTPLASLLGFIETLRGPARDDPDAQERFLAIMQEQASRMARLVADLLSLSRIEMNEHSRPVGRVDVGAVIRGVAAACEMRAEERGMTLTLDLPDALPPVMGDTDELAQVFQNLIDNAIKYSRDHTPIEIVARHAEAEPGGRLQGAAVAVSVTDHGEGIAREHLPRLTERFFRIDNARSRKLGGTGLGLAIVKHVVNRHRGALRIDSTIGKGSIFTVVLPAAE